MEQVHREEDDLAAKAPSVLRSGTRPVRPVVGWAAAGAVCTLIACLVYLRWFTSGDASAVGLGSDRLPTSTKTLVWVFEVLSSLLAVWAVAHAVRSSRRQGRLSLDAMLVIGWAIAWWHDPLINWLRPSVFYNAAFVNLGSWSEQVPGWISPNGRFLAEPIFGIGAVYLWLGLGFGMIGCAAMRRAQKRWPGLGPVGLVCIAFAVVFALEFLIELSVIHNGLVGYPSSIRVLTLWAGTTHQVPVYEQLLWSGVLTCTAALRFFTDVDGRSVVERGAGRVAVAGRARTALCVFAVVGFVNVVALGYDVVMNAAALYAGHTATYPSYLRTHQCGPGTAVQCPGPGVPVIPRGR